MNTVQQWLDEYTISHRHPANKRLHWVCVPLIVLSVACALMWIPLGNDTFNAATVVGVLALLYYVALSWRLGLGMTLVFGLLYALVLKLDDYFGPDLLIVAVIIFVLSWIGQFIGHHIEGRRPSFLKDLQFLLIGPLWLLADIYRRLSLPI